MPPRPRTPTPAQPESPPSPTTQQPDSGSDAGGWFRNTGHTDLTVLGDGQTAVLAPGRIGAFNRTPTHRDLEAATEADYRAQQDADAARVAAEDTTPSTDETQE